MKNQSNGQGSIICLTSFAHGRAINPVKALQQARPQGAHALQGLRMMLALQPRGVPSLPVPASPLMLCRWGIGSAGLAEPQEPPPD